MTTRAQSSDSLETLLQDAAAWRLLGLLFECPSPAWHADVSALAREVGDRALGRAARRAQHQASEGLYHSVFGPGGPAPPREVSYHASLELGSLLSAIAADYAAFDYRPACVEPPDHVAVEAGFVAYLRFKEAYACANGDKEAAGITRRAADRFATEHLAPLAGSLATLLAESGVPYLADASRLLASRVGPGHATKRLPVIQPDAFREDDDGGFECAL